jgi:hypothetical protein
MYLDDPWANSNEQPQPGYTQMELADEIGTTQGMLPSYEGQTTHPPVPIHVVGLRCDVLSPLAKFLRGWESIIVMRRYRLCA